MTAAAAAAAANAATHASFDTGSGLPQWDAASVQDAIAKVSAAAAAAADARADSMSSAKMAAHQKDKKENAKKGTSKKKNKSGQKNQQGQGGKDADNSEASEEELTRRTVKEVRPFTPVPIPGPNPEPCPARYTLGNGGRWHRQNESDARPRAGCGRERHDGDEGEDFHDAGERERDGTWGGWAREEAEAQGDTG